MTREEVMARYCRLGHEVYQALGDCTHANDCFCGQGGFWGSSGYTEDDYRNDGVVIEWVERAVREAIARHRGEMTEADRAADREFWRYFRKYQAWKRRAVAYAAAGAILGILIGAAL